MIPSTFLNQIKINIKENNIFLFLTSFVSSFFLSSSSFLRNFCAISSSDKRDIRLRKRSRRSAGPSANKPKQEKKYSFPGDIFCCSLQIGSPN